MGRKLTNLNFEQWVVHIFDHPVTDPAWHWDMNADWWSSSPEEQVHYLKRLFESAGEILKTYSDGQINQALWYLVGSAAGDYMSILEDTTVSIDDRKRCIQSILNLHEQLFAKRCDQHLSSFYDKPDISPLNSICYMWWDIIPIHGVSGDYISQIDRMDVSPELKERYKVQARSIHTEDHRQIEQSILDLMSRTLEINHVACRESALHGLGHWQKYFPTEVPYIIESWLNRNSNISEALRQYAERARFGGVL